MMFVIGNGGGGVAIPGGTINTANNATIYGTNMRNKLIILKL
jgi:hypothetical protein